MASLEELRAYYHSILPYYDEELEDRGDLQFWRSISKRWDSKRILELGCGTGRVTRVLSENASTTGVDLLWEMLTRAKQHAPRARLVAADLRDCVFSSKFDLVVLADDPISHLTAAKDRLATLKQIASHLEPEGRVVFDGLYRRPGADGMASTRAVRPPRAAPFTLTQSWEPGSLPSIWNVKYCYRRGPAMTNVASTVRSWTLEEVEGLRDAGLQVEALWGDFDERPFSPTAPRIVIVARLVPSS
jgi:SAM-dependent methyltransferase